jgi:hypothetical protein
MTDHMHNFRRLALEHGGAAGRVNECVIVRAHDRSLPLKLRMFFSSNRAQKSFSAEEGKEAAQDWEAPKVIIIAAFGARLGGYNGGRGGGLASGAHFSFELSLKRHTRIRPRMGVLMLYVDEVISPAADTEVAYAYSQAFVCLGVLHR